MQNIKKNKANSKTAIALVLITFIVTGTLMTFTPTAQAIDFPTWIIASASPSPVGVGQPVYLNAFMTKPNQGASMGTAGTRYEGLSIVITAPNGKQTKLLDQNKLMPLAAYS